MKSKNNKKKILVAEDYETDTDSIIRLLIDLGYDRRNIHVSDNMKDAEQFINSSLPDMIILDLQIPLDENTSIKRDEHDLRRGLSFLRKLKDQYKDQIHIVVLSRYPDAWVVYQVLLEGVSFIEKKNYKEVLPSALEQVPKGHIIFSSIVVPYIRQIFPLALRTKLDNDDIKIVQYILRGLSDREIANKLNFTEEGIAGRLKKMFRRFDFHDREELAIWFRNYYAPVNHIDLDNS